MRGQGIAAKMFAKLKDFLPEREGILFIKANNKASLQAHQKMGMCKMAEFIYEGTEFLALLNPSMNHAPPQACGRYAPAAPRNHT
jgi:RimJ/RimL family protein N-acetyltransferase